MMIPDARLNLRSTRCKYLHDSKEEYIAGAYAFLLSNSPYKFLILCPVLWSIFSEIRNNKITCSLFHWVN